MVVHKRKVTRVNKKNVHKSVNRKSKKKTRNDKRYSKKIMRGGISSLSNKLGVNQVNPATELEFDIKAIGKYYELHIFNNKTLLIKKKYNSKKYNNSEEYNALPVTIPVRDIIGDYFHRKIIVNRQYVNGYEALKAFENKKPSEFSGLNAMSRVPILSGAVSLGRNLQGRTGLNTYDHTNTLKYGIEGALRGFTNPIGADLANLLDTGIKTVSSQGNKLDSGLNKVLSTNKNVLLQNEIISKFYKVVRDKAGKSVLVRLQHITDTNIPESIDIANEGYNKLTGKYEIFLSNANFNSIKEQIPHVDAIRNLDVYGIAVNAAPGFSSLVHGKQIYDLNRMGLKVEGANGKSELFSINANLGSFPSAFGYAASSVYKAASNIFNKENREQHEHPTEGRYEYNAPHPEPHPEPHAEPHA
jgi:hypothetical protein